MVSKKLIRIGLREAELQRRFWRFGKRSRIKRFLLTLWFLVSLPFRCDFERQLHDAGVEPGRFESSE